MSDNHKCRKGEIYHKKYGMWVPCPDCNKKPNTFCLQCGARFYLDIKSVVFDVVYPKCKNCNSYDIEPLKKEV